MSRNLNLVSTAPVGGPRMASLAAFCLAAPLLIAMRAFIPGAVLGLASLVLALRTGDPPFRRRMAVLLGTVALLSAAPIRTTTSNQHFLTLGIPFLLVIVGPALILRRTDPGVIRFRFWPPRFLWSDMIYVAVAIPLSWLAFKFYLGIVNPEVPTHWVLSPARDREEVWRLFVGINCVGIWDELFFVNTVFAVLRSVFPYRTANVAQAVVYTSVLFRMAFTGIGPFIIYLFALTQGAMFEKSENLFYVLLVHLIVDAFLFAAILGHYYPGFRLLPF